MADTACLAMTCHGHATHPWHKALDDVRRHRGALQGTPVLIGSVAYANITFGSVIAAADWAARNGVAKDATLILGHDGRMDRPVHVEISWTVA